MIQRIQKCLLLLALMAGTSMAYGQCVVTSLADDGTGGTLREAINNCAGGGTVTFDPALDGGVIQLETQAWDFASLGIEDEITIDGTGVDITVLGGETVDGDPDNVFTVDFPGSGTVIRGLSIGGGADGINIGNGDNITIEDSYIGTNTTGDNDLGNEGHGIFTGGDFAGEVFIRNNVISNNGQNGVQVNSGTGGEIAGNRIGVNRNGDPFGNGSHGIQLSTFGGVPIDGTSISDNVISANGDAGVQIIGPEPVTNMQISGNNIGVDENGEVAAGYENGLSGMLIQTDVTGVIGGDTPGEMNIISNNTQHGISFDGGGNNGITVDMDITGNYIGIDANGDAAGNGFTGISINEADGVRIGGDQPGEENIISGNEQSGIYIEATSNNSEIVGNLIGTNPDGMGAVPNQYGIQVVGGNGHTIGGPGDLGNLISGNDDGGVFLQGGTASVTGNDIGLNNDGTDIIPSGGDGVLVSGGDHLIGQQADGTAAGNVIAGHTNGINLDGGSSVVNNNQVGTPDFSNGVGVRVASNGNTIGEDGSGNTVENNETHGIQIDGGSNNAVDDNVIDNNGQGGTFGDGMNITGGGADNEIGTTAGNVITNNFNGLSMTDNASGNQVGSDNAGNTIHSNGENGIFLEGANVTGNTVSGNTIGTDGALDESLENGGTAVFIDGAENNTIGGGGPDEGNILYDTAPNGVVDLDNGDGNTVSHNNVGTDGTTIMDGVVSAVTVDNAEGTEVSSNNIPSTESHAIHLLNNTVNNTTIDANQIGTEGASEIGGHGVFIQEATNSTVTANVINNVAADFNGIQVEGVGTGDTNIDDNTIENNLNNGISVVNTDGNTNIGTNQGNTISNNGANGLNVDASANVNAENNTFDANTIHGVVIANDASGNMVFNNTISNSGNNGVHVDGTNANQNTISENSTFCNADPGIGLNGSGNNNFLGDFGEITPLIIKEDPNTNTSVLVIPSDPATGFSGGTADYTVELFAKDGQCDNCEQGETFQQSFTIGAGEVQNDTAFYDFGSVLPDSVCDGDLTITVTDADGNTSQFSDCIVCACAGLPAEYVQTYPDTIQHCTADEDEVILEAEVPAGQNRNDVEYEWFEYDAGAGTASPVAGDQVEFTVTPGNQGAFFFTINASGDTCATSSPVVSVIFEDTVDITPFVDTSLCFGPDFILPEADVSGDYDTLYWERTPITAGAAFNDTATVQPTYIPDAADEGNDIDFTLTVSPEGSLCPLQTESFTATFATPPEALYDNLNPEDTTEYCAGSGDQLTITAGNPGDVEYRWFEIDDNGDTTQVGSGDTFIADDPGVSDTLSFFFYIFAEGAPDCGEYADTVSVIYHPSPEPFFDGTEDVCEGDVVEYEVDNPVAGSDYTWSAQQGTVQPATGTSTEVTFGDSDAVVVLEEEDENGCVADTSLEVTVTPLQTPEVSLSEPDAVCENTEATFTATAEDGSGDAPLFEFSLIDGNGNESVVQPASASNTASIILSPGDQVKVVMTSDYDCPSPDNEDTQTVTPTVNRYPDISVTGDTSVCAPGNIPLTAENSVSGIGPLTYQWYFNNNEASAGATQTAGQTGEYVVVGSNEGCKDTSDAHIVQVVNPGLSISTDPASDIIEQGTSVDFMLVETNGNALADYSSFNWTPVGSDTLFSDAPEFNTTYDVMGTLFGCEVTASVSIDVIKPVSPPNVITPPQPGESGDGLNDVWILDGIETYPGAEITIYNRWGNVVYEHTGGPEYVQNPWDGTRNGNPLPEAAYYYIIDLKVEGKDELNGKVSIVR